MAKYKSLSGKLIKFQREKLNLTQKETSELIGISRTMLSFIETGRTSVKPSLLNVILSKLDTTKDDILEDMKKEEIKNRDVEKITEIKAEGYTSKEKVLMILEITCKELEGIAGKRIFEFIPGVRIVID